MYTFVNFVKILYTYVNLIFSVFEYLSPRKRTLGLNMITGIFYFLGLALSPWFALWSGSWRGYLYIASVPAVIVLLYPFLICESAQWLIATHQYDRAVKCLKHVAKINKREVKEEVFDEFIAHYKQKTSEELTKKVNRDTFWGMFRTPRLRKFAIMMLLKK